VLILVLFRLHISFLVLGLLSVLVAQHSHAQWQLNGAPIHETKAGSGFYMLPRSLPTAVYSFVATTLSHQEKKLRKTLTLNRKSHRFIVEFLSTQSLQHVLGKMYKWFY
jgi:hypothetical protein